MIPTAACSQASRRRAPAPLVVRFAVFGILLVLLAACHDDPSGPDLEGSIQGQVWLDLEGDGARSPQETWGIPAVTITLIDDQGGSQSTASQGAGLGTFEFDGLEPGSYQLVLDTTSIPVMFGATTPTQLTIVVTGEEQVGSWEPPVPAAPRSRAAGAVHRPARPGSGAAPPRSPAAAPLTAPVRPARTREAVPGPAEPRTLGTDQDAGGFGIGRAPQGNTPFRFLAIGDSITRGQGSSDENGYCTFVEVELLSYLGRGEVVNVAVDGSTAEQHLGWIDGFLEDHRPAYALIMIGILDLVGPATWDEMVGEHIEEKILSLAETARQHGTFPVIATITPVNPVGHLAPLKARIDYLNGLLRELAPQRGLPLADVNAAMTAHGDLPSLFSLDGTDWGHPNDLGYQIIAAEFFATLTEAGGLGAGLGETGARAAAARAGRRPKLTGSK